MGVIVVESFLAYPWLWTIALAGLAIWLAALVCIFRSRKFLRKWLWALLTLFSFSFSWSVGGGTFGVGIPLGAIYVLWFWKFGRAPTPEQRAKAEQRRLAPPPTGSGRSILLLRIAYGLAIASLVLVGGLTASGKVMEALLALVGETPQDFMGWEMMVAMNVTAGVLALAMAYLFVFLLRRPYWWGKLICLWVGLGWFGFGLVGLLLSGGHLTLLAVALGGIVMLTAAILHQIADPRFSGSYLRPPPPAP